LFIHYSLQELFVQILVQVSLDFLPALDVSFRVGSVRRLLRGFLHAGRTDTERVQQSGVNLLHFLSRAGTDKAVKPFLRDRLDVLAQGGRRDFALNRHMRGHGLLLLRGQEHNLHIGRVPVGEVVGNDNAGSMTTLLGARDGRVSNEEDVPPVKVLSHDVILLNLNEIIYCLVVIR